MIENGLFKDYIGVVIATSYVKNSNWDAPLKNAIVRSISFESLDVAPSFLVPPTSVSMNYRMAPGDKEPWDPILVFDFNKMCGDNFKVYYSLDAPQSVAPCHDTLTDIGGWLCR